MYLSDIKHHINEANQWGGNPDVSSLTCDSRLAVAGSLFIAVRGSTFDGHNYIDEVICHGASALVVDRRYVDNHGKPPLPALVVPDTRQAMSVIAAWFYGLPTETLDLIGVTGTNGKTTTTFMIESILRFFGERVGLIGTLGASINGKTIPQERTTPESPDLQQLFREMVNSGVGHCIMEVSSEGILQNRTNDCAFNTGVFTNLTQDHLNNHGSMELYFAQKMRLFTEYPEAFPKKIFSAVVNVDDPYGRRVVERLVKDGRRVLTYGIASKDADVRADVIEIRRDGSRFTVTYEPTTGNKAAFEVNLRLGGGFQVSNALAAIGVALLRRIPPAAICNGLESLSGVPGRFELIDPGQHSFTVIVDYAHSPDGLENVLQSAKALEPKRVLCIFGCGGDRDPLKRPLMGGISARLADITIITSDNPRSEDPDSIINQIAAGIPGGNQNPNVFIEPDRNAAIRSAICKMALPGDLIVIAGKGHETGQQFADHKIPFDDREAAREALSECA